MERFFKLKEHGTNVRTEIMAGLVTFMTMAYILAVNPNILQPTGLSWESVFLATAISAGIITIAMGLFVNFPVALAPGMGLNAYFATVVLSSQGQFTASMALTAVFISGLIFIVLTVTKIRQLLIDAVPDNLKYAITVGIGLFITIIGVKNSGIMTINVESLGDIPAGTFTPLQGFESVITLGSVRDPGVLLTLFGVLLIGVLMVLKIRGAILFGIIGTTVLGMLMGQVDFGALSSSSWVPDFRQLNFWDFDFKSVLNAGILTVIFTFTFVELFDTFGTLIGTADRAGIMQNPQEGRKKVGKAMLVDAIGVSGGAMLGTSTVTAYVESSSGIAAGGRTGLTAVTTGVLFLAALFIMPLIALVPASATNAALIVVGLLMLQSIKKINFEDMVVAVPAFLTIIAMPFTYNIANGISFGIVSYTLLALVGRLSGKSEHKIHWLMWILFVLVVLRYAFLSE